MNRRALLQQALALGIGAAIPWRSSWAQTVLPFIREKKPFHRFTLGALELTVITDGHLVLSPVQPNFPDGGEKEEKELLRQHFRSTEAVDLAMNILVIKSGKDCILIDTGTGGAFGEGSGWLLTSLQDAGFTPADITAIIISHAHPDHIGGLLTKEGQPVFTQAQVYISKTEHDFWMAPTQDFSKSKFQDKALLATFTAATQKTLQTLKPVLHLFADNDTLFNCLRMELAPGHTPGHTLVHIQSGTDSMVHIADLLHSDVLSFPHPEWGFNGDTDIQLAAITRRRILAGMTKQQTKIFGYHLPWPGIGHVRSKGAGYEWIAEVYAFPG